MTTTKPVNFLDLTSTVVPEKRTQALRDALDTERGALRSATDPWARSMAEQNIDKLQGWIERSEQNDEARQALHAGIDANRRAQAEKAAAANEAALKAQLRVQFFAGNPTASSDHFERLWPTLRDQHLLRQADSAMTAARLRYGI